MFRPIDSCKPLVLSQDEEEKDRDTQETIEEKSAAGGDGHSETTDPADKEAAAAEKRRRQKEEEANADSTDKKDVGTEKAGGKSPAKQAKQNIQPWVPSG